MGHVNAAKNSLNVLLQENLQEKVEKYGSILKQGAALQVEVSTESVKMHELQSQESTIGLMIDRAKSLLSDMRLRVSDTDGATSISRVKRVIIDLNDSIAEHDAKRMSLSESIGLLANDIERLKSDRDEYVKLLAKWKTYDLLMGAVSKNGIPRQIMMSQLPVINAEISRILQDVVGFTVELEADASSSSMDIYINYGDSRRIIECASGMEKMMSSLAIRVALINVSSLPKTDLLIIDEGFGALDESNVESCNRLLKSLKRWFKNILVISHVDGVKDVVDNVVEITKKGKNTRVFHDGMETVDKE